MAVYRVSAILALSTCMLCGAMMVNTMSLRASLPLDGVAIAVGVYASFAITQILRLPPWFPVATAAVGAVASVATGSTVVLISPGLLAALFVFSLHSERTQAVIGACAVTGMVFAGHLLYPRSPAIGPPLLAVVPWAALATAIGQAVRSKRAYLAAVEERARRAEEGREHEARRRVQEERLRIARELHDAVGHHVALISVQAGAMGYLLDTDLGKARESLAHIQRASEDALEELRMTVGLLRQPGDREPTEPAGGLGRLDELIRSFTATGLRVTCEVTGRARPLPEAVDLTAYRVIQESLTNAAKHAAGAAAAVRLVFRPGVLALAVEDDGSSFSPGGGISPGGDPPVTPRLGGPIPPDPPWGHGIIGMRERAAAVGGWLTAGPRSEGGFRVLAELPAPTPAGVVP